MFTQFFITGKLILSMLEKENVWWWLLELVDEHHPANLGSILSSHLHWLEVVDNYSREGFTGYSFCFVSKT